MPALQGRVVIPVRNGAAYVTEALDSVAAAAAFAAARSPGQAAFGAVVVDDASDDGTVAAVEAWRAGAALPVALGRHVVRRGAAAARNTGVALAAGEGADLVWFLDADDLFLAPHLWVGCGLAGACPEAAVIRTGIAVEMPIDPSWQTSLDTQLPSNACVRPAAHAYVGGFPEEACFVRFGTEDVGYFRWLYECFSVVCTPAATVRYRWRPGNSLDRQRAAYQRPRSDHVDRPETDSPDAAECRRLIRARSAALAGRRASPERWAGPPLNPDGAHRVRIAEIALP